MKLEGNQNMTPSREVKEALAEKEQYHVKHDSITLNEEISRIHQKKIEHKEKLTSIREKIAGMQERGKEGFLKSMKAKEFNLLTAKQSGDTGEIEKAETYFKEWKEKYEKEYSEPYEMQLVGENAIAKYIAELEEEFENKRLGVTKETEPEPENLAA